MDYFKNRVLVLTDSLGLPREVPQKVEYSQTYIEICRQKLPNYHFDQVSLGGATIKQLYNQAEYLKLYPYQLIIFQYGIVDCSPRSISAFEAQLIERIPLISKGLFYLIRKFKKPLRRYRGLNYTSKREFEEYSIKLNELFSSNSIISLGIIPGSLDYEKSVPGIRKKIDDYNTILKSVFKQNYIETTFITDKGLMTDHHHLNVIGHKLVSDLLVKEISKR